MVPIGAPLSVVLSDNTTETLQCLINGMGNGQDTIQVNVTSRYLSLSMLI